jgi:hypothetical protein
LTVIAFDRCAGREQRSEALEAVDVVERVTVAAVLLYEQGVVVEVLGAGVIDDVDDREHECRGAGIDRADIDQLDAVDRRALAPVPALLGQAFGDLIQIDVHDVAPPPSGTNWNQ